MLPNERTGKTDQTGQDAQADLNFPWRANLYRSFVVLHFIFYFLAIPGIIQCSMNTVSLQMWGLCSMEFSKSEQNGAKHDLALGLHTR